MSADNWAICPKCLEIKNAEIADMNRSIDEQYGKISPRDYLRLIKERDDLAGEKMQYVFREDYQIYMQNDGELIIRYRGCCVKCGYEKMFSLGEMR
jgi:hypothetical protein